MRTFSNSLLLNKIMTVMHREDIEEILLNEGLPVYDSEPKEDLAKELTRLIEDGVVESPVELSAA